MTKRKLRRAAERALRNSPQSSSPISPAQQTANQANALRSTGPRTPEGLAVSSQNSFRHGLAGAAFRVLPTEDAAAFDALLDGLRTEHDPRSTTEDILVEGLAQHHWLAQRALRLQNELFATQDLATPAAQKQLALYLRYQALNERAFRQGLADLLKLRQATGCTENGFVPQNRRRSASLPELDAFPEPVYGPGHPEFDAITRRVMAEFEAEAAAEAPPVSR